LRLGGDSDYVKAEGCAKKIGEQLMAVACTRPGKRGKVYLSPEEAVSLLKGNGETLVPSEKEIRRRIEYLCAQTGLTIPNESMPPQGTLGFRVQPYGVKSWGELFTYRQMLSLLSFASVTKEAYQEIDVAVYHKYTLAIITLLAAIVDRLADFNSSLCVFNYTGGRGVVHTFGRHALPMVWDFAETNPFNPDGASWVSGIDDLPEGLRDANISNSAEVTRGSSTDLPWPDEYFDAIVADPPYYDNVPYADISDFFYVWLKRTIGHCYLEHFATEVTPKKKEAIAEPCRHGGDMERARKAYETMMGQTFDESYRVLKPGGPMVVVYAHKTTLGWSTLVDALRRSGFTVTEAWPIDTEKPGRLRAQESAALASSIFLVARKREGAGIGSYEEEVRPELEATVRERVPTLWQMGVGGADLLIAAVGAGLKAFTRFARVEYANGEEVPAEKFLAEVEGMVLETLLEKIFGVSRSGVAGVDGPSRFYVLWRYTYKIAEMDAGEAIVFTYTQHVELDGPQGLSGAGHRSLVEKKKGKYRLKDFTERGDQENLGLPGVEGALAPIIDILHRVLYLMENHPRKLAEFLEEAQPDRERLRLIAQVLGGVGLAGTNGEKSEHVVATTPGEKTALGKLLANWRHLIEQPLSEVDHTGHYRMY
jgi:putative DNA methylase